MAISDQIQMLVSAFIFGQLFQSTIAALLLCIKGHGSTLFQDHRRLALVLFLIFSALWAQVDFINFAVPSTSPTACQITIIGSTFFDQAARVFISGFLLWSVAHVKKTQIETVALSALMGIRAVVGVVFIIFARPQFAPVCVARSDLLPASIVVMALDIIIIGILTIRVFTLGLLNVIRNVRPSKKQEQSKAHVLCIAAFILWTVTSSFMMIGLPAVILLLRTALPAIGLLVLVSVLTIYTGALILPLDDDSITPEARSPFVVPESHSSNSLSNDDGSPVREDGFTRTANLFIVNPSDTPHDSSAMVYLEDVKAEDNNYARYQPRDSRNANEESVVSLGTGGVTNDRAPSGIFQSLSAATLEAIGSASFLAAPRQAPIPTASKDIHQAKTKTLATVSTSEVGKKRARFGWSKKSAEKSVHRIVISNPVMQDADASTDMPFNKIRTIDLAAAAASERERRDDAKNRQLVAKRPAPPPPNASDAWKKSNSTRRKEVPKRTSAPSTSYTVEKDSGSSRLSVTVNASSTSASLSPGREDVRRRSPRSMKAVEGDIETAYLLASRPRTIGAAKRESEETVMYVNNIIYDHPSMVKSIIKGAPTSNNRQRESMKALKSPKVPSESIMHRPRPCKRDSEQNEIILPPLQHTRSKSGPSPRTKGLVLEPPFSSLVNVSAAPQRPTTAAGLKKLLPSDTHSVTVDEKISMLFPAPPGAHLLQNRRSSVPSLPRIPSSILLGGASSTMSLDQESQENRASKRNTISFGSQIQNDGMATTAETPIIGEHGIYRFSANTYRNVAGSPRNSRLSGLPVDFRNNESSDSKIAQIEGRKSRRESTTTSFSSEVDGSHDDSKSAWASIHSPVPVIDVASAQMTARETYIKMRKDATTNPSHDGSDSFQAPLPRASNDRNFKGDGEGLMTAMFGKGDIQASENMPSFLLTPSPMITRHNVYLTPTNNAWHRRIGDELPAFSRRRKDLRSRTMPPPTPLALGLNKRQPPVVQESLVDQENDLPENALKEILAQLHKLDPVSRESLGYSMHDKPQESSKSLAADVNNKISLLENLEKEMGQQETFWMQMQHSFDRDSNSIIMTPQLLERTPRALPSPPSDTSSIETARSMKKRLHSRDRSNQPRFDNFNQNPSNSKVDIWQRLAEAQKEYQGNSSRLLGPGNINFLSISKGQQLSPTPPDSLGSESESGTDMDYDTDEPIYESEFEKSSPLIEKSQAVLWLPKRPALAVNLGYLWSHNRDISTLRTTSCEPAAKGLRPLQRRNLKSLSVTSQNLWSKPTTYANQTSLGLWVPKSLSPEITVSRPKAQKPARKSKRVTFLPAILENPSPLPYKRDTLGIFQFPWGEKSDSAIYDPIPASSRATLVPFVFSPNFEPKPNHPDQEPTEYSSSFFDDYEEDYEDESEMNSDDEFDESTLWEIATLLDSQDVPSRNSLFPCPKIIEDYDDEDDSEPESAENTMNSDHSTSTSAWPAMIKFVPVQPLKPLPPLPPMPEADDCKQTQTVEELNPSVSPLEWKVYLPALDNAVREESLDTLTPEYCSPSLKNFWGNGNEPNLNVPVTEGASLWTHPGNDKANKSSSVLKHEALAGHSQELLWTAGAAPSFSREHVITVQVLAADKIVRKPRANTVPVATLSTSQLWTQNVRSPSDYNWISTCAIRVQSPPVYSAPSSGRSSPSSAESSTISVITEATSDTRLSPVNILENIEESIQSKPNVSSSVSQLLTAESSLANIDALELSSKRLISLRGSKVLASRDLWESRASTVGIISSSPKVVRSSKTLNRTGEAKSAAGADHIIPHPVNLSSSIAPTVVSVHIPVNEDVAGLGTYHDAVKTSIQLWTPTPPVTGQALKSGSLWSPSSSPKSDDSYHRALTRKDVPARKGTINHTSHTLSNLLSTSFWDSKTSSVPVQHWLHATSLKSTSAGAKAVDQSIPKALPAENFSEETTSGLQSGLVPEPSKLAKSGPVLTWTAPLRSKTVSGAQGKRLWSPAENSQEVREIASAMPVAPLKRSYSYKSAKNQVSLGKIESAELWRPKWGLPESPKDWLTTRRSRKVEFRY